MRDASRPRGGVEAAASEMWCQVREYASRVYFFGVAVRQGSRGGREEGFLLCQWFVTLELERLPPRPGDWGVKGVFWRRVGDRIRKECKLG